MAPLHVLLLNVEGSYYYQDDVIDQLARIRQFAERFQLSVLTMVCLSGIGDFGKIVKRVMINTRAFRIIENNA